MVFRFCFCFYNLSSLPDFSDSSRRSARKLVLIVEANRTEHDLHNGSALFLGGREEPYRFHSFIHSSIHSSAPRSYAINLITPTGESLDSETPLETDRKTMRSFIILVRENPLPLHCRNNRISQTQRLAQAWSAPALFELFSYLPLNSSTSRCNADRSAMTSAVDSGGLA